MLGLSYSSILMPRDRRRGRPSPSDEPENVLCLSIPGRVREVSKPCPLQNNRILCATFSGCNKNTNKILYIVQRYPY